jgi:hypothetical protein
MVFQTIQDNPSFFISFGFKFRIKKHFAFMLFLFVCPFLSAQTVDKGTIKGSLVDEQNAPVLFANVLLKNAHDSVLYKGELSNEMGIFTIDAVKEGNYFLETQAIGFGRTIKTNIIINSNNPEIDLGAVQLKQASHQLGEISISIDKPLIERQGDKTVVNIENSSIQAGASVLEMMAKLPGVKVNQDGIINLKGKQGLIIAINGKPTILSGEELANMLKGMSSSNIQKVEIITNPSSKYDAAGNAGMINIVLKKNKKEGMNGNVSAGYGQGRYAKYYMGFSLSAKNSWYNIYFNYTYSHRKGFNQIQLERNFIKGDTLKSVFESNNYNTRIFDTHAPTLGMDLYLSKKTTLTLFGTGLVNLFKTKGDGLSADLDSTRTKTRGYELITDSKDKWYNYSVSAQLTHQFDTTGKELSVVLDYANYWNNTDQNYTTRLKSPEDVLLGQSVLIGDQRSDLNIYAAKADYTHPFKNELRLEAGIKSSYVYTNNDGTYFNQLAQQLVFDSARSSHFIYSEHINAAYINLNKEFKKLTIQPGLRLEQTIANGEQVINGQKFKRDYIQLFPSVSMDYTINDNNQLSLNLGRRIDRPAYQNMNPLRELIDVATYAEGNPYVKPAITYNSELTHAYKNTFFTTIGYSLTLDYISSILLQNATEKTAALTVINIDRLHWYQADFLFSKKITKWWTTNTNFTPYYARYVGKINNYDIDRSMPSFLFSCNNNFYIREGLSMEGNFSYSHSTKEEVSFIKPNYNLSLGIQKSLFHNKATLTLNVTDVFWTSYTRGKTELGMVSENWSVKGEERIIRINFVYRFGKDKLKVMHQATGAEEEKSRTGK